MDNAGEVLQGAPKYAGPDDAIPHAELFEAVPFTRGEKLVQLMGIVLNVVACLAGAAFVVRHIELLVSGWPYVLLAIAVATYLADLASGVLHWTFDTWFDETRTSFRRMVVMVREHHIYPQRIFRYGLREELGVMSWFSLMVTASLLTVVLVRIGGTSAFDLALVVGALAFSLEISFSLEFHKIGHRFHPGRMVRALQTAGLILSPEHHMRHHSREHDNHYCLINGIADKTLGRLGFFRGLERACSVLTGAVPRADDRAWRRRFGRWVGPA